jgi:hypothetical protein
MIGELGLATVRLPIAQPARRRRRSPYRYGSSSRRRSPTGGRIERAPDPYQHGLLNLNLRSPVPFPSPSAVKLTTSRDRSWPRSRVVTASSGMNQLLERDHGEAEGHYSARTNRCVLFQDDGTPKHGDLGRCRAGLLDFKAAERQRHRGGDPFRSLQASGRRRGGPRRYPGCRRQRRNVLRARGTVDRRSIARCGDANRRTPSSPQPPACTGGACCCPQDPATCSGYCPILTGLA